MMLEETKTFRKAFLVHKIEITTSNFHLHTLNTYTENEKSGEEAANNNIFVLFLTIEYWMCSHRTKYNRALASEAIII